MRPEPPDSSSSFGAYPRASRSSSRRRRRQHTEVRPHGWQRSGDTPVPGATQVGGAAARGVLRRAAPAGTSLLLTLIVTVLTAIGIARVHATTRVLELGAEITDLTAEQARLLDERRRLAAERAYLRHPDHIDEVARNRLHMIPVSPELVQTIRLAAPPPPPEPEPEPASESEESTP